MIDWCKLRTFLTSSSLDARGEAQPSNRPGPSVILADEGMPVMSLILVGAIVVVLVGAATPPALLLGLWKRRRRRRAK